MFELVAGFGFKMLLGKMLGVFKPLEYNFQQEEFVVVTVPTV